MSCIRARRARSDGPKVVLPRRADRFWGNLRRHYVADDARRWKHLAMLTLAEAADWPPDRIAAAFGVTQRQVHRGVLKTRRTLARRFRPEGPDDEEFEEFDDVPGGGEVVGREESGVGREENPSPPPTP